jgi:hypothetical protein
MKIVKLLGLLALSTGIFQAAHGIGINTITFRNLTGSDVAATIEYYLCGDQKVQVGKDSIVKVETRTFLCPIKHVNIKFESLHTPVTFTLPRGKFPSEDNTISISTNQAIVRPTDK